MRKATFASQAAAGRASCDGNPQVLQQLMGCLVDFDPVFRDHAGHEGSGGCGPGAESTGRAIPMRMTSEPSHAVHALRSILLGVLLAGIALPAMAATDLLPSWNDGASKARIVSFVQAVTDPTRKTYVPPAERIAVFDNDGTLWTEQPMYFQLAFIARSRQAVGAAAPGVEDAGAVQVGADGQRRRRCCRGRARLARTGGGDARRHDQRGVRTHRYAVARHCASPQVQARV